MNNFERFVAIFIMLKRTKMLFVHKLCSVYNFIPELRVNIA